MHVHPNEGSPRDVGGAIIDMLYPPPQTGRVPIVALTGTNGKTTVARMIECVLSQQYRVVGLTTTEGIWVGGRQVASGDTTGPWSARLVLSEPSVQAAVLETARGGIVRSGLGYDWSDVGIILNIQPDHIGQDGIHDLEDILRIKSIVAERVLEGGTVILNADDPLLASLMERESMRGGTAKQVVYFSLLEKNPVIDRHLQSGGTAYTLAANTLVESTGNRSTMLASADRFAITMHGTARFQIANLLAAIAGCRAVGVSIETITSSLAGFGGVGHNRGRVNLYSLNGAYVVVDYGHNLGAFQAICDMMSAWHSVETIGVISLPGDRADSLLHEAARVAACGFQRLIIREDEDKRGRAPGEVAGQLCQVVKRQYPGLDPTVIIDEGEAYRHALRLASPGKVIVLFYDDYNLVQAALAEAGAETADFEAEFFADLHIAQRSAAS
jgi:cyanophycin synthetase